MELWLMHFRFCCCRVSGMPLGISGKVESCKASTSGCSFPPVAMVVARRSLAFQACQLSFIMACALYPSDMPLPLAS